MPLLKFKINPNLTLIFSSPSVQPHLSSSFSLILSSSFFLVLSSPSLQFFVFNSSPVGFFSSLTSSSSIRLRWACLQFVSGGPVVFFSCSSSSSSVRLFFVKVIQFVLQLFVCSSSSSVRLFFVVSSSVLRLFVWWWVFVFDSPKKATAQERFLHKSTPILLHTGIVVDPAALEEGLRRVKSFSMRHASNCLI
ncbi:hypothetical protein V2J09_017379 [Rumex salicifolius]